MAWGDANKNSVRGMKSDNSRREEKACSGMLVTGLTRFMYLRCTKNYYLHNSSLTLGYIFRVNLERNDISFIVNLYAISKNRQP